MKVEIRKNPAREEPTVIIETPVLTVQVEELTRRLEEMDDPEIGIDWKVPADKIITSEKDRIAKGLKDVPNNR